MKKFLIVGLGNPGKQYDGTRHNVGFAVLDSFADYLGVQVKTKKFKGLYGETTLDGNKLYLLKPVTFMNLSGEAVISFVKYFDIEDVIVIYDDIDIPFESIRLKKGGSSAGHNGIKSIISHLKTDDFIRIRIGIGKENVDRISFVLGKFTKEENSSIPSIIKNAIDALKCVVTDGLPKAQQEFN